MKKLIFSVMAIAALFVTSCVQDVANDAQVVVGGEATVSFSVESAQLASRTYGGGAEATDLYYAVYNNGTLLSAISKTDAPVTLVNGTTQLNLKLATGLTYDFIFWAAAPAAWNNLYTIDWATQKMTIDPAKLVAQDEKLDAFWKKVTITVTGNQTEGVELRRPFAQVNVAANQQDVEDAAKAGLEVAQTQVKILAFTELDLFTGEVDGEQELTYTYADQATGELNGRDHLAMVYVLVNEYDTVPVTFNYTSTRGAECALSVPMLPVQRNYKTNIVGNILTSSNDFEIEVNPDFETPDNEVEVVPANVSTAAELQAALADEETNLIIFEEDINLNDLLAGIMSRAEAADPSIAVKAGKTLTINLNGKKLVATSAQTGKNYNMFDVNNGNLTVANGTIEYKHVGENMAWGHSTNLFNVTAGGVLTLDGVTAKNLGGSDMGFVAHLNNWGEVTLNVTNCTLESNYVPVRVFNSGPDMNNVTIKNSTLKGANYAFWVHNYTVEDFGSEATVEAQKALLNLDIYENNVFDAAVASVRYGFTNAVLEHVVSTKEELAEAIKADCYVALANNIVLENALTNTKNVTLKLNGNTLSAVDSASGSYGLITNQGNLTVVGPGKLQLEATNNRGWAAYSSVISNTVGGNLVVDGGVVIEHLGGTDMAYGIDNLTNGKGTSAVVTVKNATVKSPYRAIRQFLNGVEATNELYVKAGAVVEGANKSIWMQDPSANANTGKLVVEAGAQLKGNVYLYVCEGSTEWPVEVSIASSALVDGSEVLTGNVPAGYVVEEQNGTWIVTSRATVTTAVEFISAVNNVKDGGTVIVGESFNFTEEEGGRTNNGGSWWDGLGYSGDKSFTIDLNGKTIGDADGALNDYLFWFKNDGEKASTITIKNGTLDAGTKAYCALCTASSGSQPLTINLENVTLINNISNGSTIKARTALTTVNLKNGTKVIGKNSYLGIESWKATVNIYEGAEIYMNGTSSYNGCLVGVGGNGVINVYGGYGKGAKGGFIAMTSGGTINVHGGEWIANTDGTVGDNSNLYVLTAQNNKYESGWCAPSIINVTGGTLRGGMDAWILNDVNVEKAELNISGGNYNVNPTHYLVDGKTATEANGIWTVE